MFCLWHQEIKMEMSFLTVVLAFSWFLSVKSDPPSPYDGSYPVRDKCQLFSEVNEGLKEFYSPLYPSDYPNNTECILKISADFGYLIRVDFREYFDLEESKECANDFLEIRDGPHGYSDLMGRFCGSEYPPIITSKDRHLWLRFSSDDTLEYKGFRAVYEFIKNNQIDRPEIGPCKFELSGNQGVISNTDIPEGRKNYSNLYSVPLDCTWIIEVRPNQKIYLSFEEFKLEQPNECEMNYVDIFGSERDLRSRLQHFCGSLADPVVASENIVHFRFFAMKGALYSSFRARFTAFRDRMQDNSEACEPDEYDCDDATCIDILLRCDGIKHCRHQYDEEGCEENKKGQFDITSEHIIVILTLGCGLLAGMCFAMCFNCIKKLVRDGRQIHENIRRSREQLEERRSASLASSPRLVHRRIMREDEEAYVESKRNGHTCIRDEEEETEEEEEGEEDEDEDEEEGSCVEMRDCECQTRDSLLAQRDAGLHGTPPPPPPPTRRPPSLPPPNSPLAVPTPPPPPVSHSPYYNRHHSPSDSYIPAYHHQHSTQTPPPSDHLYGDDTTSSQSSRRKYRTEGLIQMTDRPQPRYEVSKSGKSTPDVLVTH